MSISKTNVVSTCATLSILYHPSMLATRRPRGLQLFQCMDVTYNTYYLSPEIKRRVLLGRKVMTNLDSILKSRDITLPTEVHLVSSVQFSSVAQSCPTLCDPMNRSTPGPPVHHHLPEFTQTHVHRVRDAIQPSNPGLSPSPPAPNLSQHHSLFQ